MVAARLLDTLAEVAIERAGSDDRAAAIARVELPVGDDDFDPGVLEELGSLGMGETFVREFIAQCLRDAENVRRVASRSPAKPANGPRCATTRTR